MNILFTICGRSGSKGLKNKNLIKLNGIPLVYYTLSAIKLYQEAHPEDDVTVAVTYNVKASQALNIETPDIAAAPTFSAGTSAADVVITVPGVGEATVTAMALHNAHEGMYKDFVFGEDEYTVAYAPNGATTDAKITIPKESGVLALLTEADYSGKAQDLVLALSDGRMVVTTLTATAAATP